MKVRVSDDVFERIEEENLKEAQDLINKGMADKAENLGVITLIKGGIMTQLNLTGKAIWDVLKMKNSIEEIASLISKEFEVDFDTCLEDVKVFIQDLVDKGFVVYE